MTYSWISVLYLIFFFIIFFKIITLEIYIIEIKKIFKNNLKWFNDENIRRKYFNRTITIYNETGHSSWGSDNFFENEKEKLIRKYFPPIVFLFYKIRLSHTVDIFGKGVECFAEERNSAS